MQLTGRGRQKQISGCLRTFVHLPPSLVLVKAGLDAQFGPSYTDPGPAEAVTNCRSLCSSHRLPRASHRQRLMLVFTRVPPKRSQNEHTHWPASENIQSNSRIQLASQAAHSKDNLIRYQTLLKQILLCMVSPSTAAHTLKYSLILAVSKTETQPHI